MTFDNPQQKQIVLGALEAYPVRGYNALMGMGCTIEAARAGEVVQPMPSPPADPPADPAPRAEVVAATNGDGMGPHGVAQAAAVYQGEDGA
jgi:hypothetical protein